MLRARALDRIAGARLWLKAENIQTPGRQVPRCHRAVEQVARARHTGDRRGNHAIAVAAAARGYGLSTTVVLPADAPAGKVRRAEEAGARVILAGVTVEQRLAVVARLEESSGDAVIDAYDHPEVVAGQGTATLELVAQAARQGGAGRGRRRACGKAGACLAVEGRGV